MIYSGRVMLLQVGETITDTEGRSYRIAAEPPRRGGQADVYRATARDGVSVAIKLYRERPELAELERRVLLDAAAGDPRADEWLVTVLGHGRHRGRPFLVFPWLPDTLQSWTLHRGLGERLRALELAAAAVVRLHRSASDLTGYRVHRDIKPANLLVAEEQGRLTVRLADLGVAKQGGVLDATENTGVLTQYYAPPEQMLPLDRPPSESWDVHALAVTVFQTITRRLPTPALQAQSVLNAQGLALLELTRRLDHGTPLSAEQRRRYEALRAEPPERLLDLGGAEGGWRPDDQQLLENTVQDEAADVDPARLQRPLRALVEALAGALDPDPRRRERSARPLLAALRELCAVVPAEERVVAPVVPVKVPPVATGRGWLVAALALTGAAGALLVGGLGLWIWQRASQREPAAVEAPAPTAELAAPVATAPAPAAAPPTAPAPAAAPADSAPAREATTTTKSISKSTEKPAEKTESSASTSEPVSRAVRFFACPLGDVRLAVDGREARTVGAVGLSLALDDGPHRLVWMRADDPSVPARVETVTVSARGDRFCANLSDGPCADCP